VNKKSNYIVIYTYKMKFYKYFRISIKPFTQPFTFFTFKSTGAVRSYKTEYNFKRSRNIKRAARFAVS